MMQHQLAFVTFVAAGLLSISSITRAVIVGEDLFVVDGMRYTMTDQHFRAKTATAGWGWNATTKRCAPSPNGAFRVYVNGDQMPSYVAYIDEDHEIHQLYNPEELLYAVERLVRSIGRETELPVQVSRETNGDAIVLQFLDRPVPRSDHRAINLDATVEWVIFHPAVRSVYSGLPEDLLYAVRHEFLHTLGLGHADHTNVRYSIMNAKNVYHFVQTMQPIDVDAVHTLLCDPLLRQRDQRNADKEYRFRSIR